MRSKALEVRETRGSGAARDAGHADGARAGGVGAAAAAADAAGAADAADAAGAHCGRRGASARRSGDVRTRRPSANAAVSTRRGWGSPNLLHLARR